MQRSLPEIKSLGAELVTISPQLPDNSLSTAEKLALEFEVLSDVGNKVAKSFGLVFKLSEKMQEIYQAGLPHHLLLRPLGSVLYFFLPLCTKKRQIDYILTTTFHILTKISKKLTLSE